MPKNHRIRYLQSALSDLEDIVSYIREQLDAPQVALNLVDRLDKAISRLECFPFSGHPYSLNRRLADEHRILVVDNYLVFYVVYDGVVEIRRVLYGKRKHEDHLY